MERGSPEISTVELIISMSKGVAPLNVARPLISSSYDGVVAIAFCATVSLNILGMN